MKINDGVFLKIFVTVSSTFFRNFCVVVTLRNNIRQAGASSLLDLYFLPIKACNTTKVAT